MKMNLKLTGMAVIFMALYGCGDDERAIPVTDSFVFPAGKATLAFSAMSTAQLAAPISGIDLAIKLPAGMSLATTSGASGQIETASVTPGSSLTGTNLAFGTYSASNGKTRLSMATTSDKYRSGEFLRLTCVVAPNTNITLGSLKALNAPVAIQKAVGYDPVARSTIVLTNNIKVIMDAPR